MRTNPVGVPISSRFRKMTHNTSRPSFDRRVDVSGGWCKLARCPGLGAGGWGLDRRARFAGVAPAVWTTVAACQIGPRGGPMPRNAAG
jgi:hypothetical protein